MKTIATSDAPAAIGPYSQAIVHNGLLYTAGQIPLDPVSMEVVPGDVSVQTERVMQNLAAVLQAAGSSFGDVLKTTVFLQDMGDFAAMNAVYGKYFANHHPARSTVAVAALPKGVAVEIELVAAVHG